MQVSVATVLQQNPFMLFYERVEGKLFAIIKTNALKARTLYM